MGADDGAVGGPTIEESATRLGHLRWAELRLFEVLGAAAPRTDDAGAKLVLASHARHHGWRADLLAERMPEVRELSPDRQTAPASDGLRALLQTLSELGTEGRTVELMVAVYRVLLPDLSAAYRAHLDRCTPVADAAVMRTLRIILGDVQEDAAEGAAVADRLVAAAGGAATAGESGARFEAELADCGGISGR